MGIGNIVQTGLKAAMTNMENISNNIANANTSGFKKSHVNFADIYSGGASGGSQAGLGVKVDSVSQDFSTGRLELTDRGLDLSIGNDGFFVQKDSASGQLCYTRAGRFDVDKDGYIMGVAGNVQGYPATNGVIATSGSLVDLTIPSSPIPAKGTSTGSFHVNLNASAEILDPLNFNSADASTYTYRTDSTVYDSLGSSYPISLFFIKEADNAWNARVVVNSVEVGDGTVNFADDGTLTGTTNLDALSWVTTSGAATPQNFAVTLTGSTQFAGDNTVYNSTQDGFPAGVPTGFNIDSDGRVNVYYSNGFSQLNGQIAIAKFKAPQGLVKNANMSWISTPESGDPIVSPTNSSGVIQSGTLELSNVDLTQELVSLMGAQHDFQANAQVQQTYNQILQVIEKL